MRSKLITSLLLGTLSLIVLLPGTASMTLWDRDEACNAQCAREMLQRKDPLVPTFNSRLRTDKPPLDYWAMMASYRILGVNEFAARLPLVLLSVGTVLLIYLFGSHIVGEEVGLLASFIMLTNLHFPIVARAATPDAAFLFFLTLSLFLFLIGKVTWGYVASGFAVLTKGPLGLIIPLGTELLYLLFSEGLRGIKKAFNLKGSILFLIITLPWYAMVDIKTHHQFYRGFILYHNFTRFMKPIGGHKGPIFYYLLVLIPALMPWSALLPHTGYHLFEKAKGKEDPFLFLYVWILFPLILFSLAKTKLPNYILPIYPALALSISSVSKELSENDTNTLKLPIIGIFTMLTALTLFLGWMAHKGLLIHPILPIMSGAILLLTAAAFYYTRKKLLNAFKILAIFMAIFLTMTPYTLIPNLEKEKLSHPFSEKILSTIKPGELIVSHPFSIPSLVFYTNHPVIREKKGESLRNLLLSSPHRVFLVTEAKAIGFIRETWKGKIEILQKGRSLYPRGELVLLLLSQDKL